MTLATGNLCKYTWEVVVCIVLTGKRRLRPDIWLKTLQQTKSIKSIMRIIYNTETIYRQKARKKPECPLSSTGKEVKCIYAFLFGDEFQ